MDDPLPNRIYTISTSIIIIMIFYINKKIEEGYLSCFRIILQKQQIQQILGSIKWNLADIEYICSKNDILSKQEIKKIIKQNSDFDFLKNYKIEVDVASVTGFLLTDFIANKTILPQKGVTHNLFNQIAPIKNRPAFEYLGNRYVWVQELGLFHILDHNKGYYNPINKCLCFKKYKDYKKYLEEINCLKKIKQKVENMELDKPFIRVISVYSKKTKKLKYHILNDMFNYNSFAFHHLKPFKNDEGIFFRSYKITKSIAKKYADWSNLVVDYDFENNEYYFETLEASDFFYSQKELLSDIRRIS